MPRHPSRRGTSPANGEGKKTDTPWASWFSYAVGVLGLAPTAFWRLSLWEWLALIGASTAPAPSRGELDALMRANPDT